MFKKILATTITVFLAVPGISSAASYDDTTFNAGLEVSIINRTSYNSSNNQNLNNFKTSNSSTTLAIRKNEAGINAFVGARFTQNIGGQVGFSFIQNAKANVQNGLQASNKISNVFLDGLGFLNVAANVDVIGLIGVGGLKCQASVNGATFYNFSSDTKRKAGYRLGGGAQYDFAEQWSSRAMLIYQRGNPNFLKSLITVSLGVLYTFAM